jgi:septal ring factor EnvC (AmiA/AmiB activator)
MTGIIANVLLNVLLVGLLTATIIYCFILNRRIQTLQDSKSELATLLKQFDESTIKASETIIAMQTASKKIGDNIQLRIDKANYLLDDLSYSIEKGTRLTSQIEASFAVNRARTKVGSDEPPAHDRQLHVAHEEPEASAPEKHLQKPAMKRTPASIEAILEKVVSRKQQVLNEQGGNVASHSIVAESVAAAAVPRSRAEQELIELIRSSKV